eukprot:gene13366-28325_t
MSQTVKFMGMINDFIPCLLVLITCAKIVGPQPSRSRVAAKPEVLYEKGGSDFRCPYNGTSSFGKQLLSKPSMTNTSRTIIGTAPRFNKSETVGPGPNMPQMSALKKQLQSHRSNGPKSVFGT